jgi:hypothetical protein
MTRKYSFHRDVGSRLNGLISLCIFFLLNHFFGFSVFNEFVFVIISGVSYRLVGFILRGIGFW